MMNDSWSVVVVNGYWGIVHNGQWLYNRGELESIIGNMMVNDGYC